VIAQSLLAAHGAEIPAGDAAPQHSSNLYVHHVWGVQRLSVREDVTFAGRGHRRAQQDVQTGTRVDDNQRARPFLRSTSAKDGRGGASGRARTG
jgi:hypothetical protein